MSRKPAAAGETRPRKDDAPLSTRKHSRRSTAARRTSKHSRKRRR